MADISITAASVLMSASGTKKEGTAGEAISAGQPLYFDSADKTYKLADANAAAKTNVAGIALNDAASGQPVSLCIEDTELAIGATVAANAILILSATAGGIAPTADATTGWESVIIGIGVGSNKIRCNFRDPMPLRSGVAAS